MADEKRRLVFGRSLSEKLRCSTTGETVERIWMRLRQVKLQGSTTPHTHTHTEHTPWCLADPVFGFIFVTRNVRTFNLKFL